MNLPASAAERARYHLFAALALSSARSDGVPDGLRRHARALRKLIGDHPGAAPMAQLVRAMLDAHAGNAQAGLRACEQAAAGAEDQGEGWLAALAYEEAARQAAQARLPAVALHLRHQASGNGNRPPLPQDDAQRAAILGELGVAIAHEVNQPLAAIALNAAAARRWLRRSEPDIERALASLSLISTAGRQAGDVVRSVYRLVARQNDEVAPINVDEAVREVLRVFEGPLRKHSVEVELAPGLHGLAAVVNRVRLQQVVTNLVQNAVEALAACGDADGRHILITTHRYNDREIEIAVADNGPGVAQADRERIFEPLFSTKRGNTGLGLSISREMARCHGGDLVFEPRKPHGACFRLRLPLSTSETP